MSNEVMNPALNLEAIKVSPYVYGDTDFNEINEIEIDETKIYWLGTNTGQEDTPQEKLENRMAIQEQVNKGIIDEFGIPTGFTYDELGIGKDQQEQIKAAKAARHAQIQQQQQQPPALKNTGPLNPSLVQENKRFQMMQQEKFNGQTVGAPGSAMAKRLMRQTTREQERQERLKRANDAIRNHQKSK